jgi:hypothetical protein
MPRAFSVLAWVRDRIVAVLGLKPQVAFVSNDPRPMQIGEQRSYFRLLAQNTEESLLGDEDRHLDFRVSLLTRQAGEGSVLWVTTAVRTHNRLGRVYLAIVRPVHRRLVPASARTMARLLGAPS